MKQRILASTTSVLFVLFLLWARADEGRRETALDWFVTIAVISTVGLGIVLLLAKRSHTSHPDDDHDGEPI